MPDLKTYLASKYMSGPKADAILAHAGVEKKKRKRKNEDYIGGGSGSGSGSKASGSGLVLQDEDERWGKKGGDDDDDDDAPVIGKGIAEFKKGKSAWSTVGGTALPLPAGVKEEPRDDNDNNNNNNAAAGPSSSAAAAAAAPSKQQMTKRKGGLRTAKQLAEEAARTAEATRSPSPEPDGVHTQTVHRDQSGKVLDVEALRAQAKAEAEEEKRMEAERRRWGQGTVQRDETEKRVREEMAMGKKDVARYADDAAMNRELKEVDRWNDPAANFMTGKSKKGKKVAKIPVYKGSWPENRFGLAPGYRWDGVDRSNGFEKKWLQAQNTYARDRVEFNKWSMEDM